MVYFLKKRTGIKGNSEFNNEDINKRAFVELFAGVRFLYEREET